MIKLGFFGLVMKSLGDKIDLETLIEKFTTNPRHILNVEVPHLTEGAAANLTLFDVTTAWTFTKDDIKSKSKNTPYLGMAFVGKPFRVIR